MATITAEVLRKLATFDTPTICNLIELFEIRSRSTGYMDARIKACFPEMPPIVGFAATATFRSAGPPHQGEAQLATAAQVERFSELSGPPLVVFQDLDQPSAGATFGELMCTTYQAFGAVGLITSGTGRDLEQVRALKFPVFTNGAICSHGYCHAVEFHIAVQVGGLVVYPDDLLHGDLNGVTNIPHDIAAEVADIGDDYVAAEGIILEALRNGRPTIKTLQEARAEAKARVAKLRERVSRASRS